MGSSVNADVAAALSNPEVKSWIENHGGVPGGGTPRALAEFQAAETVKWREVVRKAGIKPE